MAITKTLRRLNTRRANAFKAYAKWALRHATATPEQVKNRYAKVNAAQRAYSVAYRAWLDRQ